MIPKFIKISGVDFEVKLEPNLFISDDTISKGEICFAKSLIRISSHIDLQVQELTLLHEIYHGIVTDRKLNEFLDEDMNEYFVNQISHGLYQVLRQNSINVNMKKVNVSGVNYDIIIRNGKPISDIDNCIGHTDIDKCHITIDKNTDKQSQNITLLHAIVFIICNDRELGKVIKEGCSEVLMNSFACGLYQVLKENKIKLG